MLGGATTWPLAARAQQTATMRRVAMLLPYHDGDAEGQAVVAAFQLRLQDLGWTEAATFVSTLGGLVAIPIRRGHSPES